MLYPEPEVWCRKGDFKPLQLPGSSTVSPWTPYIPHPRCPAEGGTGLFPHKIKSNTRSSCLNPNTGATHLVFTSGENSATSGYLKAAVPARYLTELKSNRLSTSLWGSSRTRKGNNPLIAKQVVTDGAGRQRRNPREYDPGNRHPNGSGKTVNPGPTPRGHVPLFTSRRV